MTTPRDEWKIAIFVPEAAATGVSSERPDPARDHVSLRALNPFARIEEVPAKPLREQWAETIAAVMDLGAAARERADEWTVDEIEVGLTLSAKGKLLFIAEAGAEASIKLKLVRVARPDAAP